MSVSGTGGPESQRPHQSSWDEQAAKELEKIPTEKLTPAQEHELMNSPFAKMFEKSGAKLTVKEMQLIMKSLLDKLVKDMKHDQAQAKKASQKLKDVIEGKPPREN